MAADLSSLRDKVMRFGQALHEEAVAGLLLELDARVPDSGGKSLDTPLKDTRVVTVTESAGVFSAQITYTSPKAEWTEKGTEAHPIPSFGSPGPVAFNWPKVGKFVVFNSVNWKPGPGVAHNIGWFSTTMATWPVAVAEAQQRLPSIS